jgi:serine/threonine-protein kinase
MKTCPTCQATYPDTISFCARDGAELRSAQAWAPGTVVRGRYRILSKIGEGGMGAVYKAQHTGFDELRAIKVLNPELTGDEKFHQRFKQEAYITRKLQHPNAVRVEDIDEADDGCPFIVMEYIEGKSLKQVMLEQGPLPAPRVCALAKQVAAALDAAHSLGMVHRDIKPENIVLVKTPEGEKAKVLDFGIARIKEGGRGNNARSMDLTGSGFVMGTPLYISPEQAQGKRGDDLDGRSDLYSLGIVMYQMLTGDVPFKSDTAVEMLIAQIQKPPHPIRMVRPDLAIPDALASLVMRMLQKKREQRPPSAAALMAELTRIEMAMPVLVSRIPPKPGEVVSDSARRNIPAVAPLGAVAYRPPYTAKPLEPRSLDDRPPVSYFGRALIALLVVGIGAGIWYFSTHRPSDELARHQAAALDFEGQQLYPQAEEEYRAAVQLNSSNAALQSALGHVLVEERKWDEAISALRAAISLQPDDAVAHNNLGVALQTVGNVADAIPEFREAIRVRPDYLEAHSNLGHALEKQNDLSGSIIEYREVLRLKPDDADAHFHIALAEYKQGNSDGAVDEYREAIRIQPGFALAHFGLGGVLYNRGEHDAGIEELRTAYSLSPDDPEIRAAYQKLLEK